jgi:hypothetical protein
MTTMVAEAYDFLAEQGYKIGRTPGSSNALSGSVELDSGNFPMRLVIEEEHTTFAVYLFMPTPIPEVHRYRIMEYITRVNHRLFLGHFEMDLDVGEVRFVHCQFIDEARIAGPALRSVLRTALDIVSIYFPGIMRIIHGGFHSLGALAEVDREQGMDRNFPAKAASQKIH